MEKFAFALLHFSAGVSASALPTDLHTVRQCYRRSANNLTWSSPLEPEPRLPTSPGPIPWQRREALLSPPPGKAASCLMSHRFDIAITQLPLHQARQPGWTTSLCPLYWRCAVCFWVASGFLAQLTRTVRASGLSFGGIVVKDFGERVCLASCVESRWPVLFFFPCTRW